jgi:hypothetical protein
VQRRGSERRRFVRVADEVVASVTLLGGSARDGRTLNFSAGGVLFEFEQYLDPGTDLSVVLRLDDESTDLLEFDARVVRVRTMSDHVHEIAAEFVGGSAADQRRLQEHIASRVNALMPPPAVPPLTA